jgi:hypothetical protein
MRNTLDFGYEPKRINQQDVITPISTHQEQTIMTKKEYPSISKGVPKLTLQTAKMWHFQMSVNAFVCSADLGKYLFGSPFKQKQEDVTKSANAKTAEQKKQENEYQTWVDQWKAEKNNLEIMGYAYAEILKTLEEKDKEKVMAMTTFPNAKELVEYLISEYKVNTLSARTSKVKNFINMEWKKEGQTFAEFVSQITQEAREINGMEGSEVVITDGLKFVVLMEGVRVHHEDAFRTVTEMIEQSPSMDFDEAVRRMRPVARRFEIETETAYKAKKTQSMPGREPANERPECFDFKDYGYCKNGSNCRFHHGTPGTKRCALCNGKHRPKFCTSKPKNHASKAKVSNDGDGAKASDGPEVKQEKLEKETKAKQARSYFEISDDDYYSDDDNSPTAKVARDASSSGFGEAQRARDDKRGPRSNYGPLIMWIGFLVAGISMAVKELGSKLDRINLLSLVIISLLCATGVYRQSSYGVSAEAVVGLESYTSGFGQHSRLGNICMMASSVAQRPSMLWGVDSMCSNHLAHDQSVFDPGTLKKKVVPIEVADGRYMYSTHVGDVTMRVKNASGTISKLKLEQVLCVPDSSSNLISVGKLLSKHHRVVFDNSLCKIANKSNGDRVVVKMVNSLFEMEPIGHMHCHSDKAMVADYQGDLNNAQLWHRRLCHYSHVYVDKAIPGAIKRAKEKVGWCEACMEGGIERRPFRKKPDSGVPVGYKFRDSTGKQLEEEKTQDRLDLVAADTCQPFSTGTSTAGNKYFFLFVDIHTRKKWIRFGKQKSDLKREFKDWLAQVRNETGRVPVQFSPDGGGEFDNKELAVYLKEQGILFEVTCTDCPNQNAFVERANGLVQMHIKKLLAQAGLPDKYWQDAAKFSVEVQNAMPVKSNRWKSPNQAWGARNDKTLKRVRTFGCEAWYVIPQAHRKKGDQKARKGLYLGTSDKHNGWKILDLQTRKIVNSRDVYFHEDVFPFKQDRTTRQPAAVAQENDDYLHFSSVVATEQSQSEPAVELAEYEPLRDDGMRQPVGDDAGSDIDHKHSEHYGDSSPEHTPGGGDAAAGGGSDYQQAEHYNDTPPESPQMRTRRQRPDPTGQGGYRYTVEYLNSIASAPEPRRRKQREEEIEQHPADVDVQIPEDFSEVDVHLSEAAMVASALELGDNVKVMTRKQVLAGPDCESFLQAEERELASLKLHGTYRVVPRPKHRTPITCRWTYDIKRGADNQILLHKARLVAHGFKQVEGIDYNETFAATAQMKSFRGTLALSELLDLRVTQIDISSAFLHGELEEEIYMEYPPGYTPKDGGETCLKLQKGIYGLRQAGRIWNLKFVSTLTDMGFTQLVSDTQVLKLQRGKSFFIIGIHVDDATLATNDEQLREEVLGKLKEKFLVKDLGDLSHYLGMRVTREGGVTEVTQDAYVEKLLARFNMDMANPADTPGLPGQVLSKEDCPQNGSPEQREMEQKPFRSLVGSLMYAYIGTRPDIGSALVKVAAFCNNPGVAHWVASKRILRYLKGTKRSPIRYSGRLYKGEKVKITVFCDSDWAQDKDDRKSTSGYVVLMAGGPVSWRCKKQPTVALSATEAEFVALTEATRDVIWLTHFLDELGIQYEVPTIYSDSQSAIDWSKNACHHQRSKHVALKYFFIRDTVADRKVKIAYVSTKENVADILTKSTTRAVFWRLQPRLMGVAKRARRMMETIRCFGAGVRQNV